MIVIILIAAYLLGSLPFGYIMTRFLRKTDIREQGSGNIGATNVLRVIGWKAALPVFILDMVKGTAAVLLAKMVGDQPYLYLAAGLAAMLGHSFPLFISFKGGKAVATTIGVMVVISGWITLAMVLIFGLIVALTRYVSLASIIASLLLPLLFWAFNYDLLYIIFGVMTAMLVALRHRENIMRLIKGKESKIGDRIS